jgi:quercetin dioxygenase-like cupin family protein
MNKAVRARATELTFAPDGYVGVHHHVGPGIRYVISGELTFAEGGQETIYKSGEYYFETGNLAHTAQNKTNLPLRVLVVEILPKDWTAPAMIAPKPQWVRLSTAQALGPGIVSVTRRRGDRVMW